MKVSAAYFVLLLILMQALEHWTDFPGADFVAMYNPIIWAAICAIAGSLYPLVSRNEGWASGAFRLAFILVLVQAVSTVLYLWFRPKENLQIALQAGIYFLFFPSLVAVIVCYSVARLIVKR